MRGLTDGGVIDGRWTADRPRRRDPSSDLASLGHLLPQGEKGRVLVFAGDWTAFDAAVEGWPEGVRETVREIAAGAWRNGVA